MNRFIMLFLLVVIVVIPARAQPVADGILLETTSFTWPEFEAVRGFPKSVTKEEYDATRRDQGFVMETLRYASGGNEVNAYAYHPESTKIRLPVIVYCRGGYVEGDLRAALGPVFRRYAEAGYAVIAPMLRQSDGAGGKDEVGGGDLADVMNIATLARELPWADSSRLYLLGISRGGMMAYQAIRDGFPAKAAVAVGAFTDFDRLISAHPKIYAPLVRRIWEDYDQRKDEIHQRRSAVLWADRIKVPLLILHGTADSSVNPAQALDLAARLQAADATYELHIVQEGDHTLDRFPVLRDGALLNWFGRFR